jgi:hypothetical protein
LKSSRKVHSEEPDPFARGILSTGNATRAARMIRRTGRNVLLTTLSPLQERGGKTYLGFLKNPEMLQNISQ